MGDQHGVVVAADLTLTGQTWYDALNRSVKQIAEGAAAAYAKSQYDLANRLIATYTGYSPGSDDDPWTIGAGDKIFERTLLTLDGAGNAQLTTSFQRNNGDTSTGEPDLKPCRVSIGESMSVAFRSAKVRRFSRSERRQCDS